MSSSIESEIYLVRHGETEWSRSGQHTGVTDIPLTEHGRQQARLLRPDLASRNFQLVLTSPLQRARRTCELAGLGQRAQIDPDLMEWNYGAYEGLTSEQIHVDRPAGPSSTMAAVLAQKLPSRSASASIV